jgi:hypothetical protein
MISDFVFTVGGVDGGWCSQGFRERMRDFTLGEGIEASEGEGVWGIESFY